MQDSITRIYIDQDLSAMQYIAWLGHNEFSPQPGPQADFRIVFWVVWQAFLIESDGWLPILWSSILGLPSQFLKLNFSLSQPENLVI